MPEINANFVVESVDLTIDQSDPGITVTPEVINMTLYTAGYANPSGNTGAIQYNSGGFFGGIPTANYIGGNFTLGNVNGVKLLGGSNAYFLQTDGTGNLTWAPGTVNANSGNGIPVGANTQIQITDGTGNFVSAPGFTFDYIANSLTVPGDVYAQNYYGTFLGNLANGNSNIRIFANSNIAFSISGNANVVLMTGTQLLTANANIGMVYGNANLSTLRVNSSELALGFGAASGGNQGFAGTAIGYAAGIVNQGAGAIAIGKDAGGTNQGIDSIAIGEFAGYLNQPNNTIILNATGSNLSPSTANALYVKPVRNTATFNVMFYNETTGEITQTDAIQSLKEKVVSNSTGSTGTINFDLLDSAILFKTANATTNFIVNLRGNSTTTLDSLMSANQSLTCTFINTNGGTPYTASNIQIDGSNVGVLYPSIIGGTPNGKDLYTFNVIKTAANTFTVFGSVVGYS